MAKCLYKNIFTCLVITFFAFNNATFSQNQWRFYNGDDIVAGTPIQLDRLMDKIHVHSEKNSVGSVCLVRESKEKFSDKILIMPSGFMIFIYQANDGFIYWIAAKANSEAWLNFIKSVAPDNAKKPIGSTSKRKQLTTQEQEALNILMDEIKGLYCRVEDSLIKELLNSAKIDNGIDFDELKKLADEKKKKRQTKERQDRLAQTNNGAGKTRRLVVYNNKIYGVDIQDGFVYCEIEFTNEEISRSVKQEVINQNGTDFIHLCSDLIGCYYYTRGVNIGILKPTGNIKLPEQVKKQYGIRKYKEDEVKDNVDISGRVVNSTLIEGLYSCPPKLSYNESFPGLDKLNINTYLIDGDGVPSLSDWYLFMDKAKCNRCSGIDNSHEAEIYSPFSKLSVKISNTFNMEKLTTLEYSKEKANLLKTLKLAFKLAADNRILNNKIEYLGEGGLVYRNQNGKMTITVGETTMTYNGKDIPLDKYNEWLGYFDRQKRKVNQMTPKEIVNRTFKAAAMGKENWFKEYRQSPLAFIAKYCVSSPTFK